MKRLILSLLTIAWPLAAQQSTMEVNSNLFVVMAAINAAGYDAEISSPANSPIRKEVRQWLDGARPPVLDKLKEFYKAHRKADPARDLSQYISFALCIEMTDALRGAEFRYRIKSAELPPDVLELDGFDKLLTAFYRETKIAELLARNQPLLDQALQPYHSPVSLALQQIDGYLRNAQHSTTKGNFHVYLDALAAPNQIHVRSYSNDLFVVITSSPEPQIDYIKSAYMHFVVDPIAMRYIKDIESKSSLIDFAQGAPALDPQYKKDFALLTVASMTKAIDARMAPTRLRPAKIDEALKEGFILTPYFAESLSDYEKQEQSMRMYLPILIKGIDLRKETTRLDAVSFANAPRQRMAKPSPQPIVQSTPAEITLDEAEEAWGKKDFKKASELFRRSLEETNARPLKARSYYGMARVAALNKDPQLAVDLFEKTIAEGAEPQISAWAHVFAGRLLDLAQESAAAKKHFEAAIATVGASPASRKAAEDGLKGVQPSRP